MNSTTIRSNARIEADSVRGQDPLKSARQPWIAELLGQMERIKEDWERGQISLNSALWDTRIWKTTMAPRIRSNVKNRRKLRQDRLHYNLLSRVQGFGKQPWSEQLGQMGRIEGDTTEFTTIRSLEYKDLKSNHHGFNNQVKWQEEKEDSERSQNSLQSGNLLSWGTRIWRATTSDSTIRSNGKKRKKTQREDRLHASLLSLG